MSSLLASYRIPSILLEAQTAESRFRHPQAHFLNTRTMEILRHSLPAVYKRVLQSMGPVSEWQRFRFTTSMSDDQPLAEVLHFVDRPLQAGRDSNGILLKDENLATDGTDKQLSFDRDLSPCTVGHLAQHTFCRILYDYAKHEARIVPGAALHYGTRITNMETSQTNNGCLVTTSNGVKIKAATVVAADGSNSLIRRLANISQSGEQGMQYLMNVHVKLPPDQATVLHANNNHAMLYTVFSPLVVAMTVCHSVGEYIIQIPYFPPFQKPEDDFGPEKLSAIVQAVFGSKISHFEIVSAKSWTMSALIADRYYGDSLLLVGDAAHVFPPAGGFGMNTGLQDVHNAAWKLAWLYHNSNQFNSNAGHLVFSQMAKSYQAERRPIAQQNAALSVRNYQRLLQVMKACYLNDQHPTLLQTILKNSPLPLQAQRSLFCSLLQTALHPLSWLASDPQSRYARHIRSNLHQILQRGAGLPLLFPKHELGLDYDRDEKIEAPEVDEWKNDTQPHDPCIQVGRLVPHLPVQVAEGYSAATYPNIQWLLNDVLSTCDLPSQVARTPQPTFALLRIDRGDPDGVTIEDLRSLGREVSDRIGLPVEVLTLCVGEKMSHSDCDEGLVFFPVNSSKGGSCVRVFAERGLIWIRPDGHVAFTSSGIETSGLCSLREELCGTAFSSAFGRNES
jgi:2-polyprenyl-6-methoxyphenol hydroxylase-like FAD-dependent oxidoreductase